MILRFHQPQLPGAADPPPAEPGGDARSRLNLLLSCSSWRHASLAEQMARLLTPLGIRCVEAHSCNEATELIRSMPIHIAVVDLSIPMSRSASPAPAPVGGEAGSRVLQLLRRLDQPPPTVVVRPRQATLRDSARGLADALREGAFAVVDGPVRIEVMLEVLRRVVRRHYRDHWPGAA